MNTDHKHIAVVDDEPDICETVKEYLELKGFRVSTAANAVELRRIVADQAVDLVVLDITMPGEDGLSLTRYLRENTDIYIVMLTSADDVIDRIVGLEVGADDYLSKPVDLRELHARIKAVMRRARSAAEPEYMPGNKGDGDTSSENIQFGKCRLHLPSHKLFDEQGKEVPLTAMEFQLLSVFAKRPNRVLSREQLLSLAHNREWDPFDRSLDLRISRVRRKIEADPGKPQIIKTVHGLGYIFAQQSGVAK